jgi:hypothetical protein
VILSARTAVTCPYDLWRKAQTRIPTWYRRRNIPEGSTENLARDGVERIEMDSSTLTAIARAATANDTSDRSFDVEINSERRGCEADDQLVAECYVQRCRDEHPVGREVERRVTNESKITRAYYLTVDLDRPAYRTAPLQMNDAH